MNEFVPDADVVVVGAGLAGLSAAHFLAGKGYSVVVLEEDPHNVGGRARSTTVDGVTVDVGAQFISDFYHATLNLIDELGLKSELAHRSQKALITRNMKPEFIWPLPSMLISDGLPLTAKLRLTRLLPELIARWRYLDVTDLQKGERFDTESAATNLGRICGSEDLNYFFAPILRALLYWEADTTSMLVVLAIFKAFVSSKQTYYMSAGIGNLSKRLAANLDVRRGIRVESLRNDGTRVIAQATDGTQTVTFTARGAICAVPATVAADVVDGLTLAAEVFLKSISYTRTALLTYRIAAGAKSYPEGAILFPVNLVADIASINPVYSAGSSTGSEGGAKLLDVFLSTEGFTKYCHLPDGELGKTVLDRIPQLISQCDWVRSAEIANVQRWPEALPRFTVGHVRRVQDFRKSQKGQLISFAGDYLDGPYIDGALRSGLTAAEMISVVVKPQLSP